MEPSTVQSWILYLCRQDRQLPAGLRETLLIPLPSPLCPVPLDGRLDELLHFGEGGHDADVEHLQLLLPGRVSPGERPIRRSCTLAATQSLRAGPQESACSPGAGQGRALVPRLGLVGPPHPCPKLGQRSPVAGYLSTAAWTRCRRAVQSLPPLKPTQSWARLYRSKASSMVRSAAATFCPRAEPAGRGRSVPAWGHAASGPAAPHPPGTSHLQRDHGDTAGTTAWSQELAQPRGLAMDGTGILHAWGICGTTPPNARCGTGQP